MLHLALAGIRGKTPSRLWLRRPSLTTRSSFGRPARALQPTRDARRPNPISNLRGRTLDREHDPPLLEEPARAVPDELVVVPAVTCALPRPLTGRFVLGDLRVGRCHVVG